ncbi:hypothetical protein EVB55_035 [Rhizobium phage RHph_Y68]|uniref:Uncharacterized protein n=1 Tax=Rhizobium phage RHph_Y68 TaxID=2509787 RepID=A0A7S5QY58_9CAUD|nr:hypothetical protein PP934_gp035 [Rhizobium phage RHph_Y68]QIG67970.1 hypothetical protein EVB55_035 [Rhizobium phage RHph_Y68]
MKISELIRKLVAVSDYGDLDVKIRAPVQEGLYDIDDVMLTLEHEDGKEIERFAELEWS